MIEKTVTSLDLSKDSEVTQNLRYWLTKTPQQRLAAVDYLRKQLYGDSVGFQRVARVVQCPPHRKKDLADLEALGQD
jgi:hypothetical protein